MTQGKTKPYQRLSLQFLNSILSYDPETGIFKWKVRPYKNSRRKLGDIAGRILGDKNGKCRRYIGIDKHQYLAIRLAWFLTYKEWPRQNLGTKNGKGDDLRIDNIFQFGKPRDKFVRSKCKTTNKEKRLRIPIEEYNAKLASQNNCCAICGKPETAKRNGRTKNLAIDHCHSTDEFRGLLCSNCNPGIGYFKDNPALLYSAIEYVEDHLQKKNGKSAAERLSNCPAFVQASSRTKGAPPRAAYINSPGP